VYFRSSDCTSRKLRLYNKVRANRCVRTPNHAAQTVRLKSFRTDFFKNRRHVRKKNTFVFIQNKLHWHIYRLLRGSTVSEKLPKFPLFWIFFYSSITASWISATSAKWSPFNFIFNLGNRK